MTMSGLASSFAIAKRLGFFITSLGADRYQIADARGRIMLRNGGYHDVRHFFKDQEAKEVPQQTKGMCHGTTG